MSADSLAMVLRVAGADIEVVFLNACYSEVQARALATHIPCVVGMPDTIGDDAAILYAGSFYRALASGRSVANAHEQGIASLQMSMPHGQQRDAIFADDTQRSTGPRLLSRPDVDAKNVYLVACAKNQTYCTIVIEAKLSECDPNILARITEELRQWTGDFSLRIVNVEHGSVRLTVILSVDASQRLMAVKTSGHLTQLGGFLVRDIAASPRSTTAEALSVRTSLLSPMHEASRNVTWSDATKAGSGQLHTRLTSAICELVHTLAPRESDYIELMGEDLTTALIAGEDVRRTFRRRPFEGAFRLADGQANETLECLSLAWNTYNIFLAVRNHLGSFVSIPSSVQESIMKVLCSEGHTTEAAKRIAITTIQILNKSFGE